MTKKCEKGYFYRKSYTRTRTNGKTRKIQGRCIRSQSPYSHPLVVSHMAMRGYTKRERERKEDCPEGFITRSAYIRKTKYGKKVRVPEQCIIDRGLPGKGIQNTTKKTIGSLRKGELAKFGYANIAKLSIKERREALRKAIQEYGSLSVWRKLNAVHVYTRRTAPTSSRIFKEDMNWIRNEFGIKAFKIE